MIMNAVDACILSRSFSFLEKVMLVFYANPAFSHEYCILSNLRPIYVRQYLDRATLAFLLV